MAFATVFPEMTVAASPDPPVWIVPLSLLRSTDSWPFGYEPERLMPVLLKTLSAITSFGPGLPLIALALMPGIIVPPVMLLKVLLAM